MAKMEIILDQTLERIVAGAKIGDVLQQHPAQSGELEQLLSAAVSLRNLAAVQPSPALKRQMRHSLAGYLQAHPRSIPQHRTAAVISSFARFAAGMAAVLLALILVTTVAAQSALPGQSLFALKLTSEEAFRAIYPHKLAVDLALAERRIAEIEAVSGDPLAQQVALAHYQQVVARLLSYTNPSDQLQVQQVLAQQRQLLEQLNVSMPPGLEELFNQSIGTIPKNDLIPEQLSPTQSPVDLLGSSGQSTPLPALPGPTLAPSDLSTVESLTDPLATEAPSILPGEDPLPVDPELPIDPGLPVDPGLPIDPGLPVDPELPPLPPLPEIPLP
jgi:hypothetical protein